MSQNKNLEYYLTLPYKVELDFEPEDKMWVAFCPELGRGSCYSIGKTKEEALSLLEDAKKEILKYAIEENKEIPEPKFEDETLPSGQFVVRLPKTLHKKLKDESEKEGVSLNQYVLSILSEASGMRQATKLSQHTIQSQPPYVIHGQRKKYSGKKNTN